MLNLNNLSTLEVWLLAASVIGCLFVALLFFRNRTSATPPSRDPSVSFENLSEVNPFSEALPDVERRVSIRREGTTIGVLISDQRAQATPDQGYVLDRSTGGLRIASPRPVLVGTILSVRTDEAPPDVPWVQVQIRNCIPVGDYYQLGCRFVQQPPWNVLLLFG
jgi:PilZ domain